jgi:hypothetical protein
MTHSISETVDDALIALAESVASIDAAHCSNIEKREALTETFAQFSDFLKANAKANNMNPDEDADEDAGMPDSKFVVGDGEQSNAESVIDPLIARHVAVLRTVRPDLTNEEALRVLIQTPRGRQLSAHLRDISKSKSMSKTSDPTAELTKYISTSGNIQGVAKHIVEKGESPLTESQLHDAVMSVARTQKKSGETDAQSFARLFESNADIRKAQQIARDQAFVESAQKSIGAYQMQSVNVAPVSTNVGNTNVADDSEAAYQQLKQMAEQLAASAPYMSVHQAFEQVFTAQENASLAVRAIRRNRAEA